MEKTPIKTQIYKAASQRKPQRPIRPFKIDKIGIRLQHLYSTSEFSFQDPTEFCPQCHYFFEVSLPNIGDIGNFYNTHKFSKYNRKMIGKKLRKAKDYR